VRLVGTDPADRLMRAQRRDRLMAEVPDLDACLLRLWTRSTSSRRRC
jgi:hypothetical protein